MKLLTLDSRSSIPQDTRRVLAKNYQKNQRTQMRLIKRRIIFIK